MQLKKGGDYELAPEGTHLANLVSIIDMGTQQGDKGEYQALNLVFELSDERNSNNEKFLVGTMCSQTLTKKSKLGKIVIGMGFKLDDEEETFDIFQINGRACQVTLVKEAKKDGDGDTIKVSAVSGVPKGVKVAKPTAPITQLGLNKEEFDQEVYEGLQEWLRDKISETPEYIALKQSMKSKPPVGKQQAPKGKGKGKDDVPF